MTAFAILFTLAAFGISETAYLVKKRKADEKPVCVIGGECSKVLKSKYNTIFGLHNDLTGLLFYFGVAVITAMLVIGSPFTEELVLLLKVMVAGATVMSIVFIFIMWRLVKAWCFWCLMSAFTIFTMAIILVSNLLVL